MVRWHQLICVAVAVVSVAVAVSVVRPGATSWLFPDPVGEAQRRHARYVRDYGALLEEHRSGRITRAEMIKQYQELVKEYRRDIDSIQERHEAKRPRRDPPGGPAGGA